MVLQKQIQNKVLQNVEQENKLYRVVKGHVPSKVMSRKNNGRTWVYGYNEEYDMVIISKTGQVGEVINISGLNIGLPIAPKDCIKRSETSREQYWERKDLPK